MSAELVTRPIPGRVAVTARANQRLLAAVSAQALGVPVRRVRVTTEDEAGRLAVHVTGALAAERGPFLEYLASARERVAAEASRLTGAQVARVTVHITEIITPDRKPT